MCKSGATRPKPSEKEKKKIDKKD